jgi:hypothetical protein
MKLLIQNNTIPIIATFVDVNNKPIKNIKKITQDGTAVIHNNKQ